MKFTVIIPVYNVEDYLDECINSVLNQSYKNYEIILVDDGSTDESGIICDRFEKDNPQIMVIHKKNGGLSSARNIGIQLAKGDYVVFLDSDDYWDDENALEKVAMIIQKYDYDVLNFHYKKNYEKSGNMIDPFQKVNIKEYAQLSLNEKKYYLVKKNQFIASACNKIIKKAMFEEHYLFFDEGKTSEDINWCARLLVFSKNMGICNEDFYVYRQRNKSITHTVQLQNLIDLKNNLQSCLDFFTKSSLINYDQLACYNYLSYTFCTSLICYYLIDDKSKKELLPQLKKYLFLLNYHQNKKVYIFYIINKYLGSCTLLFFVKVYSYIYKL